MVFFFFFFTPFVVLVDYEKLCTIWLWYFCWSMCLVWSGLVRVRVY